jgi:hypothetical protein
MEVPQGNSLWSSLKQAKMSFYFPFTKSENTRAEQVLPGGGRLVPVGGGRIWREDVGG